MKYARFHDNTIVEVFTPPEGFTIEQCFHPSVLFVEIPTYAEVGWIRQEDGAFADPNPPAEIVGQPDVVPPQPAENPTPTE